MKTVEGVMTGDFECWCLAVSRQTFIDVTGRKPTTHDKVTFACGKEYKYQVYPSDLFGREKEPIKIEFSVTKIEK